MFQSFIAPLSKLCKLIIFFSPLSIQLMVLPVATAVAEAGTDRAVLAVLLAV